MSEERKCTGCESNVVSTAQGIFHVGGGDIVQECKACQWKGSQVMGFVKCPRCGDATALVVEHRAS